MIIIVAATYPDSAEVCKISTNCLLVQELLARMTVGRKRRSINPFPGAGAPTLIATNGLAVVPGNGALPDAFS